MSKLSFIPYHVFCFTVLLSEPILNHIDATGPLDAENYILCLREKIKALKKIVVCGVTEFGFATCNYLLGTRRGRAPWPYYGQFSPPRVGGTNTQHI